MDDDEKMTDQMPEQDDSQESQGMTRRQFLIGAGVGLAAGAAGTAGVISIIAPKTGDATTFKTPGQSGSQAQPNLPATMRQVTLNIDGKNYDIITDVRWSLWEVMTYQLGMSSANVGCDRAQCGACAVAIDGRAVNSCTILAARMGRGQKIMTVDGLSKGSQPDQLHPIAKAFWQEGGFQCGICTRGFMMSTYALLIKNPTPTDDDIREAVAGNICRCSEYPKIFDSVHRAAEEMRKKT